MSAVPTSASVGVPPRNMVFDHEGAEKRYPFYDGNALASLMFVVFSGIFPPGERFFVDSVRAFRDRIEDPVLKAQVSGFIGQEALHGREHDRLNQAFAARGIAVEVPERYVRWSLRQLKRLPRRQQLACTLFMEHFTAHLAERWLKDERFKATSEPEMMKLWLWHALEELEHKAVAYDVFEAVGGTWGERAAAGALVVGVLLPGVLASWGVLLAKEGQAGDLRGNLRGLGHLFGRQGFLTGVIRRMPDFFGRRFHPRRHDTAALEAEWREILFGAEGRLNAEFRNREALAAAAA
ncbi:metal-dependent hydrolase [Zavarzinia compransoris]|uniref:Metal-dependent hydrolase n=1 Tax=Zavarzinia compransoris TaxID=1264899 RepID=A0A317E5R4_9PROT|nr:metal-dependent hydrolase [Zavarzinia compransoris]PWR21952.1 metal-dependent hydrolase [Zavarzinia compransoris]TDP47310.1 hypothetical protein DES42_103482 [Zavarzinia compransoris]